MQHYILMNYKENFECEEALEEAISRPSEALIETMKSIEGDIMFLGVAGKMGISMARMAKRACLEAKLPKRIIGVSRFSNPESQRYLGEIGIEIIKGDLLDKDFMSSLPEVQNVIFLAGMKFGTDGNEARTWAINSYLPGLVAEKFKNSRILAFSTGCVYPLVDVKSGGSKELDFVGPVGEYAQSCLGRERLFEFGSTKHGTPVALIRLNYSVEMRYGVLVDIATKVYNEEPINISMGYANVIWQGDANDMILRALKFCGSPARYLNISGPETLSVREVAIKFGELMNKNVVVKDSENTTAYLVNCSQAYELLGKPKTALNQIIVWTANWILAEKKTHNKPTRFEVRSGNY
ncbi:hypothetical protein AB1A65_13720 [Muricauda sp. ANG21]|uniref:NAD-dependent epimerase/dehydratase family protein n=1 Tax=Allomuricauda sp. ANG21 TaxID=3042468 RepID=UPI0034559693